MSGKDLLQRELELRLVRDVFQGTDLRLAHILPVEEAETSIVLIPSHTSSC